MSSMSSAQIVSATAMHSKSSGLNLGLTPPASYPGAVSLAPMTHKLQNKIHLKCCPPPFLCYIKIVRFLYYLTSLMMMMVKKKFCFFLWRIRICLHFCPSHTRLDQFWREYCFCCYLGRFFALNKTISNQIVF